MEVGGKVGVGVGLAAVVGLAVGVAVSGGRVGEGSGVRVEVGNGVAVIVKVAVGLGGRLVEVAAGSRSGEEQPELIRKAINNKEARIGWHDFIFIVSLPDMADG